MYNFTVIIIHNKTKYSNLISSYSLSTSLCYNVSFSPSYLLPLSLLTHYLSLPTLSLPLPHSLPLPSSPYSPFLPLLSLPPPPHLSLSPSSLTTSLSLPLPSSPSSLTTSLSFLSLLTHYLSLPSSPSSLTISLSLPLPPHSLPLSPSLSLPLPLLTHYLSPFLSLLTHYLFLPSSPSLPPHSLPLSFSLFPIFVVVVPLVAHLLLCTMDHLYL